MICWTLSPSQPMLHCGCGICSSMTFSCWRRVVLTRLVSESGKVHIMLINWIITEKRVYKFEWTLCSSSFPCRHKNPVSKVSMRVYSINHSHAFKFGHVLYFLLEYSLYHSLSWGTAPFWSTKCRQFAFVKNGNSSSTKGKYLHWVINLFFINLNGQLVLGGFPWISFASSRFPLPQNSRPSASLRTASPPVEGDGFRWPWSAVLQWMESGWIRFQPNWKILQ